LVSGRRIAADLSIFGGGYVRSRVGLFFALIFPIILILIFGAIFSGSSGPISAYVQNKDGSSPVSIEFLHALNSTKSITLIPVDPSQNFTQYLLSHSSSDGIVIPKGFSADFTANPPRPVNVTIYGNPTSTSSAIISGVTYGVVNAFNLGRAGAIPVIGVQSLSIKSQSYKYIDFLIPGLVGFSVLTSPMFALVNISSQYKRDKIF